MTEAHSFFTKPRSNLLPLAVTPRLASWMAANHPDQIRLREFLAEAERVTQSCWETLDGPLALLLDVGLPSTVDLLNQNDLDNYLFPLVSHLSKVSKQDFVSVWASKRYHHTSTLRVERATPAHATAAPRPSLTVRTTASSMSAAFKQQIDDQLAGQASLPNGAVSLQLSFIVGPRRNWMNLWKPTIDALGRLLGRPDSARPWHTHDGRIVDLGLHCTADSDLGNDVMIAIATDTVGAQIIR